MSPSSDALKGGKLRFKRSEEERRREYKGAAEEEARRARRKRGSAGEGSGPSKHPTALFGDDLLRAERFEAKEREERDWSSKLNDLLHDDSQAGFANGATAMGAGSDDAAWEEEMMRIKGEEFSGEAQQEIPKRWRDAAQGFESSMGRGTAGLKELDEEEYAEYIREGMHRRKHAKQIAFEEDRQRAWEEAQSKKKRAREERREARRVAKEEQERKEAQQALVTARAEWERRWEEVMSLECTQPMSYLDVPWPTFPGPDLTKQSVGHFLLYDSEKQEASQRLRKALLRYHPDRFLSSRHFASMISNKDKERVQEAVERVAKILNDILHDRRSE